MLPGIRESVRNTWLTICGRRIPMPPSYCIFFPNVRWDNRRLVLSDILQAISAIGYRAHPYDSERQEQLAQKNRKSAINRLWVAGLSMMQVMMYAVPLYLADGDMTADIELLMRVASLILTLPVVTYSSIGFYRNAWRDLRRGRVGMDVPVSLGILLSFLASV